MDLIYRLIGGFVLGFFILLFYQKIIHGKSIKLICLLSVPLCFALYMFFAHPHVIEPIRSILGIFILGFSLWAWQRTITWAALVLSFMCGYLLWIASILLATPIGLLLGAGEEVIVFILLFTETIAYFAVYHFVKLKNGLPYINDFEIKGIIFAATGIILAFFGIYHLDLNQIPEYNRPLFFASIIALIFLALGLGAFILYLSRKHKQLRELEQDRKELVAKNHKYKDVIPAIEALMAQVRQAGVGDAEKYLDVLAEMAADMTAEFEQEQISDDLNALQLPTAWAPLELRIAQFAKECIAEDIGISIQNSACAKTWDALPVSKLDFVRLVSNLLGNAKKELHKTDTALKYITVLFRDKFGFFEFEVHDTAHPFPTEVLIRLGERGNSTNNTGDGYPEIFEFLQKYKASLTIIELFSDGACTKRIKVSFDARSRIVFRTNCRTDELRTALKQSNIEVEAV